MLYGDLLGRTEEAVTFLRQALEQHVRLGDVAEEGKQRYNLAIRLRELRRLDEARAELGRAIACAAQVGPTFEVWMAWHLLAVVETEAGDHSAATKATHQAVACYLAYRRDGGENHNYAGRICLAVTQSLLAGNPVQAASLLQELAAGPDADASFRAYFRALQDIVAGNRNRTLAGAPDLDYTMAAEILFLIETLEQPR